ncbi:ABC transporter permease [Aliikangiella coralliicola]|uniref:FtsX-like permease family protein n=1 Tax=Aliikangiella coralliicola TaxID=2592383 RepID=A0A545TRZ8_9GAMM|nr:FtsX-like permease family protein [Aliikangiella coralliicola]TQV79998.1 FtsX-like permease family protein [Aliikangiella coralliicola]
MEFRPILNALKRRKTGAILVALQVAITLAIVINAIFIIGVRSEKIGRDTGMDVNNIFTVSVRGFGPNFNVVESIKQDLRMIRSMPGVVSATISNHIPLSGSGSGTGLRTVPDLTIESTGTARYRFSEHGIETLGVNISHGRNFKANEVEFVEADSNPPTPPGILVTQALADSLFPEGGALGKQVFWGDMSESTIIGIIEKMHGSWVGWDKLEHVVIQPGKPAYQRNRYIIRTEPGERDRLMLEVEEKLSANSPNKIIQRVRSLEEHAARSYQRDRAMSIILVSVIVLLLVITGLVFLGLASFNVKQRTKQIGTRRALGATKTDIVRYFMLENWIITTGGAILGIVLTVGLAYWLETEYSLPRLNFIYIPVGVAILWVLGQLAAYMPARRAATISPAIATRTV